MATTSKSYVKHQRRAVAAAPARVPAAKPYIKFPSPLRSMATSNWRVADLCAAYQIPQGRCPGGGVIGILELGGGWTQPDLDKFSSNNGLPTISVTDVPLSGGSNSPGQEADAEVLLDIEVAAAVYYYATGMMPTIKIFWAPNQFDSFEAVVKAALAADCDVLSISWGADETRWEQAAPGAAQALEDAVAQAADSGLIVFAASGDNASGDLDPGANVDMPSACPHVIGCGGTSKFRGVQEKVWGDGRSDGSGTGGGFSDIFPMPKWQIANNAPDGPPLNPNGNLLAPDVAANADPQTGYLVVVNGQETPVGGTSAVAPFYAGLFAAFGRKLGFIGETLWDNPSAFTDIVTGSNGGFTAAQGPDPCTGLGVPIGTALAAIFASSGPGGGAGGADLARTSRLTSGSGLSDNVVVVQAQGRKSGAAGTRLSAESYSNFALWHGNGLVNLRINDPGITADSRVVAAVSEYATDARVDRFIGSAQMTVFNVAPTNGAVVVQFNVNWSSPLNVRVDYFVDPQQI
jgi:kumamolisin